MVRITWMIGLGLALAGCIGPSGSAPASSEEPTTAPAAPIGGAFEPWYDGIGRAPGKLAEQAAPHLGSRVRWQLNSMGYEANGGYDPARPTGPDNWKDRMRLFAGSLDPDSDLGQVYDSAYPLILAVLPGHGTGFDAGERSARLIVEGTLWGVSGGELFLKDYVITAAPAGDAARPMQLAGPVARPGAPPGAAQERHRDAEDVRMIERLATSAPPGERGELVIITPYGSGTTSDGHRFEWIEPSGGELFPGVRITGPQPSQVSPRRVAWSDALWFDNGHCWHGIELIRTAAGPYASLRWINLGAGAESRDCGMRLFLADDRPSEPREKRSREIEDYPLPEGFQL